MHALVTGGTGHIGSYIIPELIAAGHEVTGLARSDKSAAAISALGAKVHRGDVSDVAELKAAAAESDGVIHVAHRQDLLPSGGLDAVAAAELQIMVTYGKALAGTGKPLVVSASIGSPGWENLGRPATEEDPALPGGDKYKGTLRVRNAVELTVISLPEQGVRSSIVRIPPIAHSATDSGFLPLLIIEHAASLWASGNPIVLAGDFNVVPTDADIYSPDHWRDNALLQPEPLAAYAELLAQGWSDSLQTAHPGAKTFTFWDYRRNRWERDAGLRIDHVLLSGKLKLLDAGVDRAVRGQEDASDHAPVWVDFELAKDRGKRASAKPSKTSDASAATSADVPLGRYNAKRDFGVTPEPTGKASKRKLAKSDTAPLSFVIQKHWASRLYYDFRLELDGVLLSWAIPKGPSFDPKEKRIAVHVEDHPVTYGSFEGTIPARQYGAGTVIVWDNGTWEPVGDPRAGMKSGKVVFKLHGQKLAGLWELVRIAKPGDKEDLWILLKKRDAWSRPLDDYDVISSLPD